MNYQFIDLFYYNMKFLTNMFNEHVILGRYLNIPLFNQIFFLVISHKIFICIFKIKYCCIHKYTIHTWNLLSTDNPLC